MCIFLVVSDFYANANGISGSQTAKENSETCVVRYKGQSNGNLIKHLSGRVVPCKQQMLNGTALMETASLESEGR